MNTKFFFVLLLVVLVASACAPAIVDGGAPMEPAAPPANNGNPAVLPVTGQPAAPVARDEQEARRWSGEILLSDQNSPDVQLNNKVDVAPQTSVECMSEDSEPSRQSGCTE